VNGLLQIELLREVPEEKKPRKISINTKSIPHQKAA
ncbi:MAG: heat-shock protein, partial [Magnetovibrio sp.]|nr:heat-shock protein [Magnetovibrio sp.]